MVNIIVGYLFVIITIPLPIGIGYLDLLPGFVGYILIKKGIEEIRHRNENFEMAYKISNFMVPVSIVLYVLAALSLFLVLFVWLTGGIFSGIVSLAVQIVSYIILFYIIKGFAQIERDTSWPLNTQQLMNVFIIMVGCNLLSALFGLFSILRALTSLVGFVSLVYFLYLLYQMYKRYQQYYMQY